jgi:alpha-1,6-mannosyltransferase
LVLCGAVITGAVAVWAVTGDQTRRVPSFLTLYAMAFTAYLLALRAAPGTTTRVRRAALALAVVWRLVLAFAPPLLSTDVYRYVWEGRIQVNGGNPYAWEDRPDAPRWAALRDEVWAAMDHREYTAIYPPLWQVTARAVVALRDSVTAMKLFLVGCELAAWAALAAALRRRALDPSRLLVLAWSPLAIVEIAGSGHNDAFGLFWLSVALAAAGPTVVALALAAGALTKLLPALIGLAWIRNFRTRHLLGAVACAALVTAPYLSAGSWLVHSLGKYSRFWLFNETAFALLHAMAGGRIGAVALAASLATAVAVMMAYRRVEPARGALAVVVAWLLLAPSVLPWYALWLVPLLVLVDAPAVLLFTGTVALAYLVYPDWLAGSRWEVSWTVRAVEYGPCAVVALVSWFRPGATARIARGQHFPPPTGADQAGGAVGRPARSAARSHTQTGTSPRWSPE